MRKRQVFAMARLRLQYREFGGGEKTLVILHGLLGSSQNWQRPANMLAEKYRVLVVDQRNHGQSPHTSTHTLAEMREDLKNFFEAQSLSHAYVLGHSMGGMAAMEFAWMYPEKLQGLIVEDIAPRSYHNSSEDILAALAELDLSGIASRQEADGQLSAKIPEVAVRQFVLTNLARHEQGTYYWRANLPALQAYQKEIASYLPPVQARYQGATLFIGGSNSEHAIDRDRDLLRRHFPNSTLVMIPDAGHWIHFEAVEAFVAAVQRFIDGGLQAFDDEAATRTQQ